MCMSIPGTVLSIDREGPVPIGRVELQGVEREVNLAFVPEARPGDRLIVHSGIAVRIAGPDAWTGPEEFSAS